MKTLLIILFLLIVGLNGSGQKLTNEQIQTKDSLIFLQDSLFMMVKEFGQLDNYIRQNKNFTPNERTILKDSFIVMEKKIIDFEKYINALKKQPRYLEITKKDSLTPREIVLNNLEKMTINQAEKFIAKGYIFRFDFSFVRQRDQRYYSIRNCRLETAKKYGFEFKIGRGDHVANKIAEGLNIYNNAVNRCLDEKNGKKWRKKYKKDVNKCIKKIN